MVRWRVCLVLAMLLLLPARTGGKTDDEEEEENPKEKEGNNIPNSSNSRRNEESDEDDDDDDDDDEEEVKEVTEGSVTRRPVIPALPTPKGMSITRTTKKRPLECYVCAFKAETPLRACLDPTKFRVHTITCHSVEDKCFTSVISKGNSYEAVVRGCRSGCVGSPETSCCELNRCNNQAFAMPLIQPRALAQSRSSKPIPQGILFFITILLVVQTVVKVTFI